MASKVRVFRERAHTESGGPAIVAAHSSRFASVLGKAEIPGALAICAVSDGASRDKRESNIP
jgi:hypothetical protein